MYDHSRSVSDLEIMMIGPDLWVFVAALVTVYLLPGPDMAMVVSVSAMAGERNGLLVALGLAISRAVHVTLSAIGLAAAFRAYPALFDLVRWFGAAYFVWIAWKIVRAGKSDSTAPKAEASSGIAAIQRGFLTNMLNPKAFMFCALLLPQFISTQEPLFPQYLLLGTILVGIGVFFDVIFAVVTYRFSKRAEGSVTVQKIAKVVFASVFLIAAIRLAVAGI